MNPQKKFKLYRYVAPAGTFFPIAPTKPTMLMRIPHMYAVWMEVGDDIRNPSVAYGADEDMDRVSSEGSSKGYGVKGDEEAGVRERKMGNF